LVDSVAEHQPASAGIYANYLNLPLDYALIGGLTCLWNRNNGFYFIVLYGFIASHFSGKMSRLVLICAPVVSVTSALWCGFLLDHLLQPFLLFLGKKPVAVPKAAVDAAATNAAPSSGGKAKKGKAPVAKKTGSSADILCDQPIAEWEEDVRPGGMFQMKRKMKLAMWQSVPKDMQESYSDLRSMQDTNGNVLAIRAMLMLTFVVMVLFATSVPDKVATFAEHCDSVARRMSTAQVKFKSGNTVIDDYWVGYKWIDANTPKDARVMAWWDYGYQITGIAKRTSIADGNTWNHEHIAMLGRILTSSQKKAHNAIRHLADYVLVWAGGRGDDLGKSPHLARIGNSVFPDHCGDDDPRCNKFGFYDGDTAKPTPMMRKSLLYKLVMNKLQAGAQAHPSLFEEVHTSKYGLMRVFKVLNVSQESKDWIDDPKNRLCDAPGSWYCVGQYPPALKKLIAIRRSFSQVEDFNKKGEKSAYTKMIEKERGEL